MPHVQRHAEGRHVVVVASQDAFGQRQELALLEAGVLVVAAHQFGQRRGIELRGRAAGHRLHRGLQAFPERLHAPVFRRQALHQRAHVRPLLGGGALHHGGEEFVLFFLVVLQHRVVEQLDGGLRGAAGAAVTASADTTGNAGGATSVTIGANALTLGGGGAGASSASGKGGTPRAGSATPTYAPRNTEVYGAVKADAATNDTNPPLLSQLSGTYASSTLGLGANGDIRGSGGAGGNSPFGMGGVVSATAPYNGGNAEGFGGGGSGASAYSLGSAVTSGAGSPGMIILEFVEGF